MVSDHVLIEATKGRFDEASDLLEAAHFRPVRGQAAPFLLHEIRAPRAPVTGAYLKKALTAVRESHPGAYVSSCLPALSPKEFVAAFAEFAREQQFSTDVAVSNTVSDAVAALIQRKAEVQARPAASALDAVDGLTDVTSDLQGESGQLDAKRIAELFDLSVAELADAAGISRQALHDNPTSAKAQPALRHLARIACLRVLPEFKDQVALRKWYRRPLPVFANRSAEDLFQAGKGAVAADRVEALLTGDHGG